MEKSLSIKELVAALTKAQAEYAVVKRIVLIRFIRRNMRI